MNPDLIFRKTPAGEEAVRLQTKVMQRNVRTVLILVDGHSTFSDLCLKMANHRLTESALLDLERGGFIVRSSVDKRAEKKNKRNFSKKEPLSGDVVESEAAGFLFSQFSLAPDAPVHTNDSVHPEINSSTPPAPLAEENKLADEPAKTANYFETAWSRCCEWWKARRLDETRSTDSTFDWQRLKPSKRTVRLLISVVFISALLLGALSLLKSLTPSKAEVVLSSALDRDVKVGNLEILFYPKQGFQLSDVRIVGLVNGKENELRISEILLTPALTSLFSDAKEFTKAVVRGVSLSADQVVAISGMLDSVNKPDSSLRVGRLVFEKVDLLLAGLPLSGLEGEVIQSGNNGQRLFQLQLPDRSLSIALHPVGQRLDITGEGYAFKLPVGSSLILDSINFKASLDADSVKLQSIEVHALDGLLRGSGTIQTGSRFGITGAVEIERLNAARLFGVLDVGALIWGELGGKLQMSAVAKSWSEIVPTLLAEGDFSVRRGSLRGIDLVEAARRVSGTPVQGGATNFESLSGKIRLSGAGSRLYGLSMTSGLMKTTGSIDIDKKEGIQGQLDLQMQGSANQTRTPISLTGTLRTPVAQVGTRK